MKILQIIPELNVGGVETGTVDLSKYLIRKGHKAIVVSNGGQLVPKLESVGAKHFVLPVHEKNPWTMVRMVKALREIILKEKVDIVHARSRVPAWIAFFACRKTNASFITTCHGYYQSRWFSQVMGWSKLVIVPSQVIGRHMITEYHVPPENIRCIPRSVDLEKFNVPREDKAGKSEFVIGIIGRITPLIGHMSFLKAMAKVIRNMPYVKVWVIGDAPKDKDIHKREIEQLVERLGIKGQVDFLGNRQDVPELLSKMDALVLSTITQEAFGRVILEAQAAGVPVVATKVGGVVDIIDDEETGLLVQPKDVDAMAQAVMRLLRDPELCQRLVVRAKEKLKQQFTLEQMAEKTLKVYEELLDMMNILVIKISALGDVVLVTAALKALRQKFPKAKIYCLVGKQARHALQNCPYLDGIIIYDQDNKDQGWRGFLALGKQLRHARFDKVVDFQNNRKSHLLAFLSFPKESYGYDNGKWGFLLTSAIKDKEDPLAPVEHQFQVLKQLDIAYRKDLRLEMWPTDQDEARVRELLDGEWLGNARSIVGINLTASRQWPTKNWPLEHLARLCDILAGRNIRVLITGTEEEKGLSHRLLDQTKSKPAVLVGKTDILALAALIKRCRVYITPDSAPLHIAAAMQTPVICFFGPTDSKRHLPPGKNIVVFEKKPVCSPCYKSECRIKTHVCMRDITPEEVAQKVEQLLEENS